MLSILGAIFLLFIVIVFASIFIPVLAVCFSVMFAFFKLAFWVMWYITIPALVFVGILSLIFPPTIAIWVFILAFIIWVNREKLTREGR